MLLTFIFVFSAAVVISTDVSAQDASESSGQDQAIRVFLDVDRRYLEHIKIEIPFINYVRDRKQAQVHIMMLRQRTGSGGYVIR